MKGPLMNATRLTLKNRTFWTIQIAWSLAVLAVLAIGTYAEAHSYSPSGDDGFRGGYSNSRDRIDQSYGDRYFTRERGNDYLMRNPRRYRDDFDAAFPRF